MIRLVLKLGEGGMLDIEIWVDDELLDTLQAQVPDFRCGQTLTLQIPGTKSVTH